PGRVVAALFSQEVTAASVHDKRPAAEIANFTVDGNQVVGVALQPGRRIVFLALRDPIGPFVPRQLTAAAVADSRGLSMTPQTIPIETTVTGGAVVAGQVIQSDGTPLPANVRLFYFINEQWLGISSKSTDSEGRFSWDYVLKDVPAEKIVAVDPTT